jgi:uncharacterized protein (DUF4415 family)
VKVREQFVESQRRLRGGIVMIARDDRAMLRKQRSRKPRPGPSSLLPDHRQSSALRSKCRCGSRDVDYFKEAGPGWHDRIKEALRKVVGK